MDNKLKTILLRFPQYSEIIPKQVKENEDFESLCSDYELCREMLAPLEKQATSKDLKEEYLELKEELEQEVLKYLH
jgi:hypothetical protein